jgi:hypothetical protein
MSHCVSTTRDLSGLDLIHALRPRTGNHFAALTDRVIVPVCPNSDDLPKTSP